MHLKRLFGFLRVAGLFGTWVLCALFWAWHVVVCLCVCVCAQQYQQREEGLVQGHAAKLQSSEAEWGDWADRFEDRVLALYKVPGFGKQKVA